MTTNNTAFIWPAIDYIVDVIAVAVVVVVAVIATATATAAGAGGVIVAITDGAAR